MLVAHAVDFVVIGGVAERLLGSPRLTEDIDICAAGERANLSRLADALNELKAFRPPGLETALPPPAAWDAASFGSLTGLALVTRFGYLDVWFRPDGTGGYPDLIENAAEVPVRDMVIRVASIDDIIRNKRSVGDPRYLAHLPLLEALRDRLNR